MKEEDRILLSLGWGLLTLLVIVLMCQVTYRTDQLSKKIDKLSESLLAAPEVASVTDATVTDATPDEPTEVSISINPEYTSENTLEASESDSETIIASATTDTPGAIIEYPEEVEIIPFKNKYTYLGSYQLTAYAWTGNRCANGNYPSCGYTVASNSIPMGSRIYIDGYGEYVVEDRGGMASNVIDVYMGDYNTCIQFGRRTADVYLIE